MNSRSKKPGVRRKGNAQVTESESILYRKSTVVEDILCRTRLTNLIDRRATLRVAFARDDPNGVSALQAGGTAATRNLKPSVHCTRRWLSSRSRDTGMAKMLSRLMIAVTNLSKEERRHTAVLLAELELKERRRGTVSIIES